MGKVDAAGKPVIDGEVLFNANCSRCHTRGWSYDEPEVTAGGRYGPSLRGGATIRQFPDSRGHGEVHHRGRRLRPAVRHRRHRPDRWRRHAPLRAVLTA